ncbi:MAG: hypothetical protein N3A01_04850 [Bacteroidales bacterium]|nr:hypothetical protein [Bacteroidales bacterium]
MKIFITLYFCYFTYIFFGQQKLEPGEAFIKQIEGKLDRAKIQVDKLCSDPATSGDQENWYLKAYVYTQLAKSEVYKSIVINPEREALLAVKKSKELDKKRKLESERINVLFDLGTIFYNKGINFYNKALENKHPSNFEEALINFENFFEVIDLLEADKAILKTLFDFNKIRLEKVYLYCGYCAHNLKNYAKAEEYYKKLTSVGKSLVESREKDYYLAYIYYSDMVFTQGDTNKAINIIETGLNVFPDSVDIIMTAIDLYQKANRMADLATILEKVVAANPNPSLKMLFVLGQAYSKLSKDFNKRNYTATATQYKLKAIETFEKIINSKTSDKDILFKSYYNLGVIYYNEGVVAYKNYNLDENKEYEYLFKKAIPYLEEALKLSPNNKSILNMLLKSYNSINETEKAKEIEKKLY